MDQLPKAEPRLVLETGDAFARAAQPTISPEGLQKRAQLIVESFNTLGLDAYTIGERDLVLGLDELRKLAGQAEFHFLAANLLNADNAPVFEASVIKKLGDLDVGIIGLLGERAAAPKQVLQAAGLHIASPAETAKAEAKRLEDAGADLIVVLSHLGHGEERTVANAAPSVLFFIGSHTGRRLTDAVEVRRSPATSVAHWVEAGSRGKYLGRLEIYPGSGGDLSTFVDAGRARTLARSVERRQSSLDNTRKRLTQLETQVPPAGQEARHQARIDSTKRSIEHMAKQLEQERVALGSVAEPAPGENLFLNHLDPVEIAVAERADIKEKVTALQATGLLAPTPRNLPATRMPLANKGGKPKPAPKLEPVKPAVKPPVKPPVKPVGTP